jgi:hypothetical protein
VAAATEASAGVPPLACAIAEGLAKQMITARLQAAFGKFFGISFLRALNEAKRDARPGFRLAVHFKIASRQNRRHANRRHTNHCWDRTQVCAWVCS